MQLSERGKTMLAFGTLSLFAVAFEVALLATSEPLSPSGPLAAVLDRGLTAVQKGEHGAPGMAVAIVRDGAIAYTRYDGYANVTTQDRVTTDTRFRAGSVTKMFTAVSIMQLVEAGRVSLDATVATYLPSAPHASEITVRELLSHTSGIPNVTDMAFATGLIASSTTPEKLLAPLVSQPLDFTPGSKYGYSNSNYVVLGQIVEALEGRPLADVERDRIFGPAEMTQSSFTAGPPGQALATGYDDAAGSKPTAAYDESWLYGAGDLVTTATDLARFDIALMNGKLVSSKSLALMQQPLQSTGEGAIYYGLGLMSDLIGTKTFAGHHGGVPGFAADDEMIVRDRFAVIALGNSSQYYTRGASNVAIAALLPTDFALAMMQAVQSVANAKPLDPAIETKFRSFLNGVSDGSVDRGLLSPQMSAALTPSETSQIAAELPTYATLQSLTLQQHVADGKFDSYFVVARYAASSRTYQIVFDTNGLIAGFFLR